MAIPTWIKVERAKDYYTHNIGTFGLDRDAGQFMGFVVATLPDGPLSKDWKKHKRWYAVLHLFDQEGNYLETRHKFVGTTADGEDTVLPSAKETLAGMLRLLKNKSNQDVRIKLFKTEIDGCTFGLVDSSDLATETETVTLLPNDFVFYPPWDGSYDT